MRKIYYFTLFCLFSSTMLFGQIFNNAYIFADDFLENSPIELESKAYSMVVGSGGSTVSIHNITQGPESSKPDLHDVEILKVDKSGQIVWSRRFGGDPYDDQGHSLCITDDGGYMVVGSRGKLYENEDEAYRDWVFRLNANGEMIWEQLYRMGETNSECLLVQRTSEVDENYFIVGRTFTDSELFGFDEVSAKKIKISGQTYWNNIYKVNSNLKELATSMVEDERSNGFVIVGQEFENRKLSTNLFSLGIKLNGSIYRKYRNYSLNNFSNETDPHITTNIEGNAFMVTFGSGPAFDQINGTLAMMPLAYNLSANTATLYDTEKERSERPNSIYVDPDGYYVMGCNASKINGPIINGQDDRASLFKLNAYDQVGTYFKYNKSTNANCAFMVQDEINKNYILKTDMTIEISPAAGVIRTDYDGKSECYVSREITNPKNYAVFSTKRNTVVSELGIPFRFKSEKWEMDVVRIDCKELIDLANKDIVKRDNANSKNELNKNLSDINFTVYPNVINANGSEFNIEFTFNTEQEVIIQIVSGQGQLLQQLSHKTVIGKNNISVQSEKLQKGINSVVLVSKNNTVSYAKLLKL